MEYKEIPSIIISGLVVHWKMAEKLEKMGWIELSEENKKLIEIYKGV